MSPIRLRRPGRPEPLNQTAASWALKSEQKTLSVREQHILRDWLEEPSHARAYEDALWALEAVQRHSSSPEMMVLRETALAQRPEPRGRRWGMTGAIGSGAAAAAAAGLLWVGQQGMPAVGHRQPDRSAGASVASAPPDRGLYRTGVGERSAVMLPDGSVATLDTDSQLRVAYTSAERGIFLMKGQALFEVAKGKPLPFQVYAGGQRITAIGTTFDVRIRGAQVQVSMVEGVVKVRPDRQVPAGQPVREVTLRAGEAMVAAPSQDALVKPVDAAEIASWRGGLLVFDDETLGQAVAEINRYTSRPIRIADASIANYRVTGVFKTNDPTHFATAMSEVFPIEVEQDPSGAQVLRRQR